MQDADVMQQEIDRRLADAREMIVGGNQLSQLALIGLFVWFFSSIGLIDLSPGKDNIAKEFVQGLFDRSTNAVDYCKSFRSTFLSAPKNTYVANDLQTKKVAELFGPSSEGLGKDGISWPKVIDEADWDTDHKEFKTVVNAYKKCRQARIDLNNYINDNWSF